MGINTYISIAALVLAILFGIPQWLSFLMSLRDRKALDVESPTVLVAGATQVKKTKKKSFAIKIAVSIWWMTGMFLIWVWSIADLSFAIYSRQHTPATKTITKKVSVSALAWDDRQKTYRDQNFFNSEIVLDGTRYVNCTFENCKFMYHGSGPFDIINCHFNGEVLAGSDNLSILGWRQLEDVVSKLPKKGDIKEFFYNRDTGQRFTPPLSK